MDDEYTPTFERVQPHSLCCADCKQARAALSEARRERDEARERNWFAAEALALGYDPQDAIEILEGRTTAIEAARAVLSEGTGEQK